MSRLRRAAKATAVAQMFSWSGLLLSLVTVPLYLRWLGQERYGLLLTGLAFANYLMFSDAGINWASMLLIAQAHGRDDRTAIAAIVRTSFSLAGCSALLVITLVVVAYVFLLSGKTVAWLPSHADFPGLWLALGISVVCNLAMSPFYNFLVGLQETHIASLYQGIGRLLGIALAVALASTNARLGWIFAGNVAGALVGGFFTMRYCRRRHPWAFQTGPMWEPAQVRQQLRTGAKSFGMQVGNVLWGTAPVLAISSAAGAQFVPYYSIPMTLLNAPLGVISSFSVSLQAGYGEAMGRREKQWIADTVQRILRQVLLVLGLLSCGFLLLAGPFVRLWTGGRIKLGGTMLGSVLAIAAVGALLIVFRFALAGINRHRRAAVGDLLCGSLAIALAAVVVLRFGYEWIGCGVVGAALLTSGWILPRELRHALGGPSLLPSPGFWVRLLAGIATAFTAGWLINQAATPLPVWLGILLSGLAITTSFLAIVWLLMPQEMLFLRKFLPSRSGQAGTPQLKS